MEAIDDLIYAAWKKVRPVLEADQHELAKRLARRREPVLARPPRAWCVAVRACDRRIASGCAQPIEHEVTLDAKLLKKICMPVALTPPGERLEEAAQKLGTTGMGLRWARLTKVFRTEHIEGLGGTGRRLIPIVYRNRSLDPCARRRGEVDQLWANTGAYLATGLKDDFSATLTRVPRFWGHVPRRRYDEHRHPEMDDGEGSRKSLRLPAPVPDPACWYKWSRGDYYLGDDPSNWRKDFDDLGDRPPKWLKRRRRKRRPKPSSAGGSLAFRGFAWVCPLCQKTCRTVLLPMPAMNLLALGQPRLAQCVDVIRKTSGFACGRCHQVRNFSTIHPNCWNQLIAYLTGGLLYGREVSKPDWFKAERKNKFVPHVNAPASKRRPEVMEMILRGMSSKEIAAELGIARGTVYRHTNMIYAQHGVRGQVALARKLGRELPERWETKLEKIRKRLMAGWTYDEVAAELSVTRHRVAEYAAVLRRKGFAVGYQKERKMLAR